LCNCECAAFSCSCGWKGLVYVSNAALVFH
jgi:hypothetical protein